MTVTGRWIGAWGDIDHNHGILHQKRVKKERRYMEEVLEGVYLVDIDIMAIIWYFSHKMVTAQRRTNTSKRGLTETNNNRATSAAGGTDAHNESRKEYQYGNRSNVWRQGCGIYGLTYFDRTSRRMPDRGRQSLLAGTIWHGIAFRPDSTGSVYGQTLKEVRESITKIV